MLEYTTGTYVTLLNPENVKFSTSRIFLVKNRILTLFESGKAQAEYKQIKILDRFPLINPTYFCGIEICFNGSIQGFIRYGV